MGRRRIKIEKIENQRARYVCFSKRRKGLFKKAEEFCTLFDNVNVLCTVFSPAGKPFVFGDPRLILEPPSSSTTISEAESSNPDLDFISGLSLPELEKYAVFLEEMSAAAIYKLEKGDVVGPISEEFISTNTSNNNGNVVVNSVCTTKSEEEVIGYGAAGEDYDELCGLLGDYYYDAIAMTDAHHFDHDELAPVSLLPTMMDIGITPHHLGFQSSIGEEFTIADDSWMDEIIAMDASIQQQLESSIGEEMTNNADLDGSWMDENMR